MKRALLWSLLLMACGGQGTGSSDDSAATPTLSPAPKIEVRVGPVELNAAASCVEGYSISALPHRAFAFDGTVTAIGPAGTNKPDKGQLDTAAVTFSVNEWFKGDSTASTVTVDLIAPTSGITENDTPAYEVGTRLLVSGEPRWGGRALDDAIAWSCGGFTSYYEANLAGEWRQATRA